MRFSQPRTAVDQTAAAANVNSLELADDANAASLGCGDLRAVKALTAANTFDFV
jgi:hypothetical protein